MIEIKAQHDSGMFKLDKLVKNHMFSWLVPVQQISVMQLISKELMTNPGIVHKIARASTSGSVSSVKQCKMKDVAVQDAFTMFTKPQLRIVNLLMS